MSSKRNEKFAFDLVFALPRKEFNQDAVIEVLYEAVCADAVIGLGAPGLIGLALNREGEEAEAVIAEAVAAALSVLPEGTKLREVVAGAARK